MTLSEMIERARRYKPTQADKDAFLVSFVYGNLKLDGCDVTRADVEKALRNLKGEQEGKVGRDLSDPETPPV